MSGRFSSYSKDRFITPQISGFTEADIPDMSGYDPQSLYWVTNYLLNSIFRGRLRHSTTRTLTTSCAEPRARSQSTMLPAMRQTGFLRRRVANHHPGTPPRCRTGSSS